MKVPAFTDLASKECTCGSVCRLKSWERELSTGKFSTALVEHQIAALKDLCRNAALSGAGKE